MMFIEASGDTMDTVHMNDSIQACSPDLFLCNAAEKAFEDTLPNITISPIDEGCLSPDLFNACKSPVCYLKYFFV